MNMQTSLRSLLVILLGIATSISSHAKSSVGQPKVKHIIDTHIHLYDTDREEGVPWPPKDDKVLYKPHLPTEFNRVSKAAGVTGVVIVEASDRIPDNQWILDLVKNDDFYIGLVGNIDPYRDDFAKILNQLKKDPRFVGIRLRVQGKQIDYADPKVRANLKTLAKAGLSADILMNGEGIETIHQVTDLAAAIPDLRLVLNHVLGYNVDGKLPSCEWQEAVKKLAAHPNVYCKVSGLYQRCTIQPASQDPDFYRPLLDILWNQFGSDRLIYGSNWPCTKKSGDYQSFVTLVNAYFTSKGQEASEKYFWGNAAKVYKLNLK